MPASATTDKLFEVQPLWSAQIGSGGVANASATTFPLNATTNLTGGRAYIMHVNRVDANGNKNTDPTDRETIIGVLSGSNLINCVRGVEGTAQAWDEGTVIEILFTSEHWNRLVTWAEVEHNQDGTHTDITATTLTTTGAVDANTLKIASGTAMTAILDEDDLASDSATALATQQSIKAYVDNNAGAGGKYQFIIPGTLTTGTNMAGTWFVPDSITIDEVDLYVNTAGATGTTTIDVNLDGTTIFSSGKPALSDTATSDLSNVPTTTAATEGQKITIDCDAVTTTAPVDTYVIIKYS